MGSVIHSSTKLFLLSALRIAISYYDLKRNVGWKRPPYLHTLRMSSRRERIHHLSLNRKALYRGFSAVRMLKKLLLLCVSVVFPFINQGNDISIGGTTLHGSSNMSPTAPR